MLGVADSAVCILGTFFFHEPKIHVFITSIHSSSTTVT